MFHAINQQLTRLWRQILEIGLARDNATAAAHGWQAQQVKPGTWSYRDPRFSQLARTQQCPSCRGSGEEDYQARDGEYLRAACDICGNGRVGSKGTGIVVITGGGQD